MKIKKLFQKTLFGVIGMFGLIGVSTSGLAIYTVDGHLSTEYVSNSRNIAKTIADSSVDILLNRDLATLQSLIDQFLGIQGIKYIYIVDENGKYLAHTFVPGIPEEIRASDPHSVETVERSLPGIGDCVEVGSPILAGEAGTVHVGMDKGLISLKIQQAVGHQVWIIAAVFIIGVGAGVWFVSFASRPIGHALAYGTALANSPAQQVQDANDVLGRDDEAGDLARLFQFFARAQESDAPPKASATSPQDADAS